MIHRLRDGSSTWDEALSSLGRSGSGERALAEELTRRADAAQAVRLLAATSEYDAAAPGRFLLPVVARQLISRGLYAPVLDRHWSVTHLVGFGANATEALDPEGRGAFLAVVAARLRQVLADREPADTLTLLTAKHFIHFLDEGIARALVAWLAPRVAAEDAAGEYQELDYAYGQVDPAVELALCCARAGLPGDACGHLRARAARSPEMMHFDELLDLAAITHALPDELNAHWWPVLRGWAAAADASGYGPEGESLETEWLLRAEAPAGTDLDGPLTALVEAAELPQRLRDVLAKAASVRVRDLARRRLLEMTMALVSDLVDRRSERYRNIRALRAAAATLAELGGGLADSDKAAVGAAVRRWAEWLSGYQTSDWLEHHYTAIAFARWWRDDVEPAAARLRAEVAGGNRELVSCAGWERLFSEAQRRLVLEQLGDDP